jgi:hypothetical protein
MTTNASEMLTPNNPANSDVEPKGNRRARIPMSVPFRKLEAPEIPGYHTHWARESDLPRFIQAWYEFVEPSDVPGSLVLNQKNPSVDTALSGNTDLGNRISVAAGRGEHGPERLYLMKLKEELWLEDRAQIDGRNATLLGQIFRGEKILDKDQVSPDIEKHRYVREGTAMHLPALFNRKRAKQ